MSRAGTVVFAGGVLVVLLGGCGSGGGHANSQPAKSTSTSTNAALPTRKTGTTTTISPQVLASTGFTLAKEVWQQGAVAISAYQGAYWGRAVADLNRAMSADPKGTSRDGAAVKELGQLEGLPETSETPAQMAEAKKDTAALNKFFGTPGLYG
jgi:hypothetical protein